MFYISFSDFRSVRMKMCPVVAFFLIGVIPVKITHVYSLSELHWGAKGSFHPPKISLLVEKSPYVVSSIDQSPAEILRPKPTIPRMSDNSKGSSKLGMSIQFYF